MRTMVSSLFFLCCSSAVAERYVITTENNLNQPTTFQVSINGKTAALIHNAKGSLDITALLKKGKNTLTVTTTPGKNTNMFAKSVLTVGTGSAGRWKTLYTRQVNKDSRPGTYTHTFVANPDVAAKVNQVNLVGDFSTFQPVEFAVKLNGETITTLDSNGNTDLTGLLRPGKNVLTVTYTVGKNTNQFGQSVLTVGEQRGTQWNSVVKWAVGKSDTSGTFSFPIYR